MVSGLYLYSTFLVLMTTQSALQYSLLPITHTSIQCIYGQLFFYKGQFGVQHLAKGHFGMQMGKTVIEPSTHCVINTFYLAFTKQWILEFAFNMHLRELLGIFINLRSWPYYVMIWLLKLNLTKYLVEYLSYFCHGFLCEAFCNIV